MVLYDCVGCVKKGPERIAYMLHDKSSNKTLKVNKFTMAVLVGRNQVSNAKGDIYKDIVIYRGVGCDFSKLPALKLNEDGTKKTKEQLVAEATERKAKRVQKVEEIAKNKAGRPSNEQYKAKFIREIQGLIDPKYMKVWENFVDKNCSSVYNRSILNAATEGLDMIKDGIPYNVIGMAFKENGKHSGSSYGITMQVIASLIDDKEQFLKETCG